ncbi:MAG: UDP-N-acetylmuramoyl-tripeptide--D-alanyl-D-alanine ligase [Firmicutes bacterium]|nr:UDP-N-acetylmuramoyl-tripeptide--D-alanyl-D-alanine ligase [Bacillota bacterium]
MQPLTVGEIAKVTGGQVISGDASTTVTGVSTDSRQLKPGYLFVALPGERVDGHVFVSPSLKGPAAAAVVSQDKAYICPPGKAIVRVASTGQALLQLAAWYRSKWPVRTVAVTGSTGKTTAKDLTAQVLSCSYRTLKSPGNLNTEVGLPLTLFNLAPEHQVAVVELAMRGPGQIAALTQVARPEVGVITNVGVAHIELLGSQENIARAKGELLENLPSDGLAVLNGDDPLVRNQAVRSRSPVMFFGLGPNVDFKATNIKAMGTKGLSFIVVGPSGREEIQLPLVGRFNVLNSLAAIAVGHYFGLTLPEMAAALSKVQPVAMRLNLIERSDGTLIIDDVYNANPVSMRGALETLADLAQGRRTVAVVGDMLELGEWGPEAHRQVGEQAAALGVDCLIIGGSLAQQVAQGATDAGMDPSSIFTCCDAAQVAVVAQGQVQPGDVVLVKASRGMQFEQVVTVLKTEGRPNSSC